MNNDEQHIMQKHLIQYIVHDMFNSVTDDDILTIKSPKEWYARGKRLSDEDIQSLKESAQAFADSRIWKFMYKELQYHAQLQMSNAKTESDLISANEMKRIMNIMRNLLIRII